MKHILKKQEVAILFVPLVSTSIAQIHYHVCIRIAFQLHFLHCKIFRQKMQFESSRSVFINIVKLHLWYNSLLSIGMYSRFISIFSVVICKYFCFQLFESFHNPDVIIKFSIYINKYVFTYSAHHVKLKRSNLRLQTKRCTFSHLRKICKQTRVKAALVELDYFAKFCIEPPKS